MDLLIDSVCMGYLKADKNIKGAAVFSFFLHL